jgi:mannose-1-phosphate guanylyltransferase
MVFLIPAGGQGEKLWPYSRRNNPKTFQSFSEDRSLMRIIVDILKEVSKPEDIYISTKQMYLGVSQKDIPEIPLKNYLLEPDIFKNRGPGEGYAFLRLSMLRPDEPFMIVQPDFIREPQDEYLKMLMEMEALEKRERKLITGGVQIKEPVMGVDFLELGSRLTTESSLQVHQIKRYIDRKDSYEKTKELVENNDVCIHLNHNCWYPELMLDAYKKHREDWYNSLMEIKKYIGKSTEKEKTNEIYEKMEPGSTEDVTKHEFKNGLVINHSFMSYDIGNWDSVYKYLNRNDNYKPKGNIVAIDTKDSLIKSNGKKLVATLGIENLVVVETDDVVLVADKGKAGEVKRILEKLQEEKKAEYL